MGFQTCVLQQFRISTPGLTVADRGARCTCNSSWVRANSDAVPSTTQILREKFTPIRNRGRRNGVVDGIQGFGLGSGLYDGVRIANKWKLRPREGRQSRNVGVVRASMKLDPGGGGPGEENGIGRVVVNLAIAGGLTYLTITGKLSWLFDALVSLWVSLHIAMFRSVALGLEGFNKNEEQNLMLMHARILFFKILNNLGFYLGFVEMAHKVLDGSKNMMFRSVYFLARVFVG